MTDTGQSAPQASRAGRAAAPAQSPGVPQHLRARSRTLDLRGLLGLFVAVAALVACDSDSPDPAGPGGPEGPDPSVITLESNQLDAGGTGVVVSDGFARLELEPAVDDDGLIIPDRWTNLSITIGGTVVDVRRLDDLVFKSRN